MMGKEFRPRIVRKRRRVSKFFTLLKASSKLILKKVVSFYGQANGYKRLRKWKERCLEEEESNKKRKKLSVNDATEFWNLVRKSMERRLTDSVIHTDTCSDYTEQKSEGICTKGDEERSEEVIDSLVETANMKSDSEDPKLQELVGQEEIWHLAEIWP
ncbi:hypothetical protein QYM36_012356 [Artemia franciscana]|uniref:Uncharacterized protein n=1 Tax=Artemia franciscana TaxID=6661 RepID=A0AA88HSM0_ARTSF|nr:hypothetical protein QYM36_012356 [Artemia franciscana]